MTDQPEDLSRGATRIYQLREKARALRTEHNRVTAELERIEGELETLTNELSEWFEGGE